MKRNKSIIFYIFLTLQAVPGVILAKEPGGAPGVTNHADSVMINFRQSKWDLDPSIGDNAAALDGIDRRLTQVFNDSVYRLRHVSIYGGASPEGSVEFNRFLSEHRAGTLFGWFDKYNQLSDLDKTYTFYGRDWEGVLRLAERDPSLPWREETLALLRAIAGEKRAAGGREPAHSLERVKSLGGGEPYRYLYRHIFPMVRASKVVIEYELVPAPEARRRPERPVVVKRDTVWVERVVEVRDTVYVDTCKKNRKQP